MSVIDDAIQALYGSIPGDKHAEIERELRRLEDVDRNRQAQHQESNERRDELKGRIKEIREELDDFLAGPRDPASVSRAGDMATVCLVKIFELEDVESELYDYKPTHAIINGKRLPIVCKTHDDVYEVDFGSGRHHKVIYSNIERLIYPGEEEEATT